MAPWALAGCTSSSPPPPAPVARPEPSPVFEPPAIPTSAITIAPKRQMFTVSSPPHYVLFDVTNTGDEGVVEIVALDYLGDGGDVPLHVSGIRLGETDIAARFLAIDAGTHLLDIAFDSSVVPSGHREYRYRLRAKIHGEELEVEAKVVRGQRQPIPH